MIGKSLERKKEATTRNLDPVIVDILYTPMTISTGCRIVHLNHKMLKYCPQNFTHLGYVKLKSLHDNLKKNSKELNVPT